MAGWKLIPSLEGAHADRPAATLAIGLTYGCADHPYIYRSDGTTWTVWAFKSPLTTKGDLLGYSTEETRLPVGTDDQVLTADSSEALGVKWADATGGSGGGGSSQLGPWTQDDAAASQTDVALTLLDGVRDTIRATAAGTITAVLVDSNEARTAGTLTVEVTVNGTGSGLTATLDGTNTTWHRSTGTVAVSAGDDIGVTVTTDGSWAPTTADITVGVQIGSSPSETGKATRQSTTQPITDSTGTAITFDTEVWDTDSIVDVGGANPSRLTIQTAGKYTIKAGARFAANTTGDRIIQVLKNGTTVLVESGTNAMGNASVPSTVACSVDDDAAAADYYEARVFQFSGGSLNLAADRRNFLSVHRLS